MRSLRLGLLLVILLLPVATTLSKPFRVWPLLDAIKAQGSGVMANVVCDECGDEVVGVVVARLHPDTDGAVTGLKGRRCEGLGL